jgi:hypothetical protein
VVNDVWFFAMNPRPRNAMRPVSRAINRDLMIAVSAIATARLSGLIGTNPFENASLRVVGIVFLDLLDGYSEDLSFPVGWPVWLRLEMLTTRDNLPHFAACAPERPEHASLCNSEVARQNRE